MSVDTESYLGRLQIVHRADPDEHCSLAEKKKYTYLHTHFSILQGLPRGQAVFINCK